MLDLDHSKRANLHWLQTIERHRPGTGAMNFTSIPFLHNHLSPQGAFPEI